MAFKIAILGAGSVGFTRTMVRDLLCVPEFAEITIALHDINERNLSMVQQLIARDIASAGLPTKIESHLDRRKALEGAKYVFSFVRVARLETRSVEKMEADAEAKKAAASDKAGLSS